MVHELNGMEVEVRADDPERAAKLEKRRALESKLTAHDTALIAAWESEGAARSDAGEAGELAEIRSRLDLGDYVKAAMAGRGVTGAAAEYNAGREIGEGGFPMEMLEGRAKRDGDANANAGTWLDRVFAGSAAERLGISFRSVAPGVTALPSTSAGGSPVQRGRAEAASESTYTVAVSELKPARRAVHGIYSIEDNLRLPGLADAIVQGHAGSHGRIR